MGLSFSPWRSCWYVQCSAVHHPIPCLCVVVQLCTSSHTLPSCVRYYEQVAVAAVPFVLVCCTGKKKRERHRQLVEKAKAELAQHQRAVEELTHTGSHDMLANPIYTSSKSCQSCTWQQPCRAVQRIPGVVPRCLRARVCGRHPSLRCAGRYPRALVRCVCTICPSAQCAHRTAPMLATMLLTRSLRIGCATARHPTQHLLGARLTCRPS